MSDFTRVATTSDIPDPGTMLVELEDRIVVLVHVDGQYYCLDDVCTHDGGPLADGVRAPRQLGVAPADLGQWRPKFSVFHKE